jgi:hypothetical protein
VNRNQQTKWRIVMTKFFLTTALALTLGLGGSAAYAKGHGNGHGHHGVSVSSPSVSSPSVSSPASSPTGAMSPVGHGGPGGLFRGTF